MAEICCLQYITRIIRNIECCHIFVKVYLKLQEVCTQFDPI